MVWSQVVWLSVVVSVADEGLTRITTAWRS